MTEIICAAGNIKDKSYALSDKDEFQLASPWGDVKEDHFWGQLHQEDKLESGHTQAAEKDLVDMFLTGYAAASARLRNLSYQLLKNVFIDLTLFRIRRKIIFLETANGAVMHKRLWDPSHKGFLAWVLSGMRWQRLSRHEWRTPLVKGFLPPIRKFELPSFTWTNQCCSHLKLNFRARAFQFQHILNMNVLSTVSTRTGPNRRRPNSILPSF